MKRLQFAGISVNGNQENFYQINPCGQLRDGNYYFLSNDVLKCSLKYFSNRKNQAVFIGIANPHFFHVLSEVISKGLTLRRIIALDYNFSQLVHFDRIRSYILRSNNRIEFLQHLFKVRFNHNAIQVLHNFRGHKNGYVHGGVERDPYFRLEKRLWENLDFNEDEFEHTYGIKAEKRDGGLLISAKTIGDINTYYATFLCGSRSDYSDWPFTAAFGSGFLRDENSFKNLKKTLLNIPVYQINEDVSDAFEKLIFSCRYHPILFWSSNLFCQYFIEKHPPLKSVLELSKKLGCQEEPSFPEVDMVVIQDERTRVKLPKIIDNTFCHRRNWSVHSKSFAKICRYLEGTHNIEIVNVKRWIDNDQGESKLPNTDYIHSDDFFKLDASECFDSIIVHILLGHGMDEKTYLELVKKARSMTKKLIVLEHNIESRDFIKKKLGISLSKLRDILGMESYLDFCPGEKCSNRNIICVYKVG